MLKSLRSSSRRLRSHNSKTSRHFRDTSHARVRNASGTSFKERFFVPFPFIKTGTTVPPVTKDNQPPGNLLHRLVATIASPLPSRSPRHQLCCERALRLRRHHHQTRPQIPQTLHRHRRRPRGRKRL